MLGTSYADVFVPQRRLVLDKLPHQLDAASILKDFDRHTAGPLPVTPGTRRKEQSLVWETDAGQSLLPEFVGTLAALAARWFSIHLRPSQADPEDRIPRPA